MAKRNKTSFLNKWRTFVAQLREQLMRAFSSALLMFGLLFSSPASAHQGTGLAGGFASGFLHPLTGLDHALAMISVGLWGAILGRPLVIALPVIFPLMMTVGAGAAIAGAPAPPVELGIALSVMTLGLMILLAARAPVWIACAVVAAFAFCHGYAHGAELPSAADPIGYSAGFVLCTGMLHVVGITLGLLRTSTKGNVVLRTGGGAITVCGLWFLSAVPGL